MRKPDFSFDPDTKLIFCRFAKLDTPQRAFVQGKGKIPDFRFERECWERGYDLVIGVDEVGRGCFAGPVVAGATAVRIQNSEFSIQSIIKLGINDSKKLSPLKRKKLDREIRKYFYCGIGTSSVADINRIGIVKATEKAMRCAIAKLKNQKAKCKNKNGRLKINHFQLEADPPLAETMKQLNNETIFLLVDAFHVRYVPGIGLRNQKGIIKGDQKSISIAAASIMAKVYRDRLMTKLAQNYPEYQWENNKGYGTLRHRKAIIKYGVTELHRKKYVDSWQRNKSQVQMSNFKQIPKS